MKTSVQDVRVITGKGPWHTKSGGNLIVLEALSLPQVQALLSYDPKELATASQDIRGLRLYAVLDLPVNGLLGGTEFHKIRKEFVFCLRGAVWWKCEDMRCGEYYTTLAEGIGIFIPPYILHQYQVMEEDSILLVFCNTLFDPEDPGTRDTYSREVFRELQEQYE